MSSSGLTGLLFCKVIYYVVGGTTVFVVIGGVSNVIWVAGTLKGSNALDGVIADVVIGSDNWV